MKHRWIRAGALALVVALVAGCGSVPVPKLDDIWPFRKDEAKPAEPTGTVAEPVARTEPAATPKPAAAPKPAAPAPGAAKPAPSPEAAPVHVPAAAPVPVVAATYACEGNRRIQVRPLEGGAVWITLVERELRLEKSPAAPNRYTAGRVTLDLGEKTASVSDGPNNYAGCAVAAPGK